eukprot:TRINITY_DN1344_c0_g1_i1.p1 TRINITY_DN1344_c0_g1~~TRINITY_DN1344_c0_g1_i1.p1  ORF type:complete len:309 (-),score=92.66 TRINITY_DN1344_c0_g1_i1:42-968(-)
MYEGGMLAQTDKDEFLAGKIVEDSQEDIKKEVTTFGTWQNKELTTQQDTWVKLREDPLLEMKRKEQNSINYIKNNPVKMKLIKQKLYEEAQKKKSKKSSKDKSRKRKRDDDSSSRHRKRKRSRSRSPKKHRSRSRSPKKQRSRSPSPKQQRSHRPGYGLQYPKENTTVRQRHSRSDSPPRKMLSKSEERKKQIEEWENRDRETRKRNQERRDRQKRSRGMTEEEKEERLRSMMSDADQHEERLMKRVQKYDAELEKETESSANGSNFLDKVKKNTYSKDGVGSVADRLKRNVHSRARGNLETKNTFKR